MFAKYFWNWTKSSHNSKNPKMVEKKIRLGICAMDKKARSKPMNEILSRLPKELFEVEIFGDDTILNQPIESWPVVEVLICFYSSKFPTEKALEYISLRKPYLINDLEMDTTLKDRRKVYNLLKSIGIDVPFHVFVNRDEGEDNNVIEEFDEYIVVNGVQINKPLVEKPVDAENHNIHIYYPASAGGGCKHLFRKVGDRSSEFFPEEHDIRRDGGSYIYEEFVVTQGTDVKVYTVGPDYAHAEARKSPVVDGRVQRDQEKKEIRYPVILTPNEKDMARRIVTAFKQTVCGFDILRVHGRSYCCDVNGFSFVKNSRKYYEDAAKLLTELMINAVRADSQFFYSTRAPLLRRVPNSSPKTALTSKALANNHIAPGVLPQTPSVVRIDPNVTVVGDQSVGKEFTASNEDGRAGSPTASMISESEYGLAPPSAMSSRRYDLEELRCVIAVIRHGDRTPKQKIKLVIDEPKYLAYYHKYSKGPRKDLKLKSKAGLIEFLKVTNEVISENKVPFDIKRRLTQIRDVLERWEISGINRKLQMKPQKWDEDPSPSEDSAPDAPKSRGTGLATELLVILKWGGDLTPLGRVQAEELGKKFRTLNYPDDDNGGVLRLHATYRHDLKIKASDEGRVMKTAAAFAKGLLELEGQLTPILASLVTIEEKNRLMLDRGGNFEVKEETDRCKAHLNLLQVDKEIDDELINQVAPDCSNAMRQAFLKIGNPLKCLKRIHYLIGRLTSQLEIIVKEELTDDEEDDVGDVKDDSIIVDTEAINAELNNSSIISGPASVEKPQTPTAEIIANGEEPPVLSVPQPHKSPSITSIIPPTPGASSIITDNNTADFSESPQIKLYNNETYELMLERWEKLHKDFFSNKTNMFDLTKVPDVYDMIRYDILHNSHLELSGMEELYYLASDFDRCVVPQEYGIDREDKRYIGSKMCGALIEKIKSDLIISANNYHPNDGSTIINIDDSETNSPSMSNNPNVKKPDSTANHNSNTMNNGNATPVNPLASPSMKEENSMLYKLDYSHAEDLQINSLSRCVRTRLYFTSESHLHTILNVFRYPKYNSLFSLSKESLEILNNITNVSYLSQFVIRLFEDRRESNKYHCELVFSSGVTDDPVNDKSNSLTAYIPFTKSVDLSELLGCLNDIIDLYHSDTRLHLVKELSQNKFPSTSNEINIVDINTLKNQEVSSEKPNEKEEGEEKEVNHLNEQNDSSITNNAISSPVTSDYHPMGENSSETIHSPHLDLPTPSKDINNDEAQDGIHQAIPTMQTPMKDEIHNSYAQRLLMRHSLGGGAGSGGDHSSGHKLKKSNSFTVQMDDLVTASDLWERENAGLKVDPHHHQTHHHHHHHHPHSAKSRSSYALLESQESKPVPPASAEKKSPKKEKASNDDDEE